MRATRDEDGWVLTELLEYAAPDLRFERCQYSDNFWWAVFESPHVAAEWFRRLPHQPDNIVKAARPSGYASEGPGCVNETLPIDPKTGWRMELHWDAFRLLEPIDCVQEDDGWLVRWRAELVEGE